MWNKPWNLKEGVAIVAGLLLVGLLLQFSIGPLDWVLFLWPANGITLIVLIIALILFYLLRKKVYFFRFMMTMQAAIPAIAASALLTIIMGLSRQGCADMQRLKMYCEKGQPEWLGLDALNNVHELPIAIQLNQFTIDEYPPKLMVIDKMGRPIPYKKPEVLLIDDNFKQGNIAGWHINVNKKIEDAIPKQLAGMIKNMPMQMKGMLRMDSLGMAIKTGGYIQSSMAGSACALSITATKGKDRKEGWITCGSYQFPLETLKLGDGKSLVMASREPKRFASKVNIYTQDGKNILTEIEVNKPFKVNGWKIYQLSYNEQMGKWSNVSVFELVRDPWLSVVYVGIYLLIIGAIGMFLTASKKKEN